MNAMDRFKEYFGMAPVSAYEDEYLDDYDRMPPAGGARHADYGGYGYADEMDDYAVEPRHRSRERYAYPADPVDDGREPEYLRASHRGSDESYARGRSAHRPDPAPAEHAYGATRGAVALAPEHDLVDDGLVTYPETVVERPKGFADGKSIGEHFRAGTAVVLDLSALPRDEAKRMVDFAAGLVFALDGRMQKVADRERTFLLQPAGLDLTEAEIREAVSSAFRR